MILFSVFKKFIYRVELLCRELDSRRKNKKKGFFVCNETAPRGPNHPLRKGNFLFFFCLIIWKLISRRLTSACLKPSVKKERAVIELENLPGVHTNLQMDYALILARNDEALSFSRYPPICALAETFFVLKRSC